MAAGTTIEDVSRVMGYVKHIKLQLKYLLSPYTYTKLLHTKSQDAIQVEFSECIDMKMPRTEP